MICILYQYNNKTGIHYQVSCSIWIIIVAQMAGPLSLHSTHGPCQFSPIALTRMILIRASISIFLCASVLVPVDSLVVCDTGNGLPQPDPEDCSAFYQCSGDERHQFFCPTGLVFNSDKSFCDWPGNVKCTDSGSPAGSRSFVLTRFVSQFFYFLF